MTEYEHDSERRHEERRQQCRSCPLRNEGGWVCTKHDLTWSFSKLQWGLLMALVGIFLIVSAGNWRSTAAVNANLSSIRESLAGMTTQVGVNTRRLDRIEDDLWGTSTRGNGGRTYPP